MHHLSIHRWGRNATRIHKCKGIVLVLVGFGPFLRYFSGVAKKNLYCKSKFRFGYRGFFEVVVGVQCCSFRWFLQMFYFQGVEMRYFSQVLWYFSWVLQYMWWFQEVYLWHFQQVRLRFKQVAPSMVFFSWVLVAPVNQKVPYPWRKQRSETTFLL